MPERVSNASVVRLALERLVAQLLVMDKKVVMIASVPEIGSSVPKVVANNLFWGKSFDIRPRVSDFEIRQKSTYAILSDIKSTFPDVDIVYPAEVLCGLEHFRIMEGDNPLYFDDDHLSDNGATLVFRRVVVAIFYWLRTYFSIICMGNYGEQCR